MSTRRQFNIGLPPEVADALDRRAARYGSSVPAEARRYITAGLLADGFLVEVQLAEGTILRAADAPAAPL